MRSTLLVISALCLGYVFFHDYGRATAAPSGGNTTTTSSSEIGGTSNKSTDVNTVVTKALAFKALLTTTQQSTLEMTYTTTLARKWSNLPCGAGCRNGIQFGTLNAAQLTAALDLIKEALGNTTNDGFEEFEANRMAEAYLHANGGGNGYDSTLRWIAFLNTPTATGAWMLQFGGHHYAANIAFNGGHIIGATPFFQGLEPLSFTYNSVAYAPLNDEHDAMTAMLASLSSTELNTAKLSQSFNDCTMSPGETNGNTNTFPTTKVGIACSALTTTQKNLVLAAIQRYTEDMDATTAATIQQVYANEINSTYVAFTGNGTSGNASSFLTAQGNYVRIDGPTVWVEMSCQGGVVIQGQIHYHTVWRDHVHDYGQDLTGPAIDQPTAVSSITERLRLNIHPNPATNDIAFSVSVAVKDASVSIISAATGQLVKRMYNVNGNDIKCDVSALPAGMYILKLEDANSLYTEKFNKQ